MYGVSRRAMGSPFYCYLDFSLPNPFYDVNPNAMITPHGNHTNKARQQNYQMGL
jgi:hypothetical protein